MAAAGAEKVAFQAAPLCFRAGRRAIGRGGGVCSTRALSSELPLVALTRENGKNGKLAELLRTREIEFLELPCVEHADAEQTSELSGRLEEEWKWIIVTSPEAAQVLVRNWKSVDTFGNWPVASVGKATGDILRKASVNVAFTPSRATGADLVAELPGDSGPVLYPASALAASTIEKGLNDRGFQVTRLNTYTTQQASWDSGQKSKSKSVDVVAVGSPSALKGWIAQTGTVPRTTACIGGTSAKASREQGVENVFFPEEPGVENWASSIQEAVAHVLSERESLKN